MIQCSFCGHQFDEKSAHAACQSCAMASSGCGMVKCPNCGYETPGEPRLFKLLKHLTHRGENR